jgi:hypothetical protein
VPPKPSNFPVNKPVTDWSDVAIMAAQRLIAVLKNRDITNDKEGFLATLQSAEGHSLFGAAIRWAFNTHSDATFSLDLRPAQAHSRPHQRAETAQHLLKPLFWGKNCL